jgi:hypothetical protein
MTRFTVVWHALAQDELARIWLDAADRQSVTLAANAVDRHSPRTRWRRVSKWKGACAS